MGASTARLRSPRMIRWERHAVAITVASNAIVWGVRLPAATPIDRRQCCQIISPISIRRWAMEWPSVDGEESGDEKRYIASSSRVGEGAPTDALECPETFWQSPGSGVTAVAAPRDLSPGSAAMEGRVMVPLSRRCVPPSFAAGHQGGPRWLQAPVLGAGVVALLDPDSPCWQVIVRPAAGPSAALR